MKLLRYPHPSEASKFEVLCTAWTSTALRAPLQQARWVDILNVVKPLMDWGVDIHYLPSF